MTAALVATVTAPAFTQSSDPSRNPNGETQHGQAKREQVQQDQQQAGLPESFLVRAKDKHANPVMMVTNPGLHDRRDHLSEPGFGPARWHEHFAGTSGAGSAGGASGSAK